VVFLCYDGIIEFREMKEASPMKVITLHHPYDVSTIANEPVVLAMGFFDGVHAGHRAVINRAKEEARARGVKLAVLTYDQHASVVFKTQAPLTYLTTLPRKLELLSEIGVDIAYVVNFTSAFAKLTPQAFVNQYMIGLHAVAVVAGFDHTYGPQNQHATMQDLPAYAQDKFTVIEVPCVTVDGQESASTRARELVDAGQVDELNRLLTQPYQTSGVVVHGEARGREMGYPTANIETTSGERLPGVGVYAVELAIGNEWYGGMASIGYNVTFGDNRPKTVEINLFDFSHEIYGERVKVRWHHYIRGEEKFAGMAELMTKLAEDEQISREFLNQNA